MQTLLATKQMLPPSSDLVIRGVCMKTFVTLQRVHHGCSLPQSLSSSWSAQENLSHTCSYLHCSFLQKAGFMLLEVAFARDPKEKRYVVVLVSDIHSQRFVSHLFSAQKHQDAFASAFGFFLLGFDAISQYTTPQNIQLQFFGITDPVLWFFKFTFASNAATIVGGCLVTNRYKLRMPAAFVSAFVISVSTHTHTLHVCEFDGARLHRTPPNLGAVLAEFDHPHIPHSLHVHVHLFKATHVCKTPGDSPLLSH